MPSWQRAACLVIGVLSVWLICGTAGAQYPPVQPPAPYAPSAPTYTPNAPDVPRVANLNVVGSPTANTSPTYSQYPPLEPPAQPTPAGAPGLRAPAEEQVVDVQIIGNQSVGKATILSHIRTRAGRRYDRATIEKDVQRLDDTNLFADIKTSSQPAPGGRIVIFQVVERPTLRYVKFVGNQKLKKKTLLKECGLTVGGAANPFAVQEAQRKLERLYHDRGYTEARVSIYEGAKPGDPGAVFVIREGPKQRVAWADFIGNTIASDGKLRTVIESKQGFIPVVTGSYDRRKVEEDKTRLINYYRSLGFFNAQVEPQVRFVGEVGLGGMTFFEDHALVRVTFVINEGPRYKVRDVYFGGNKKFNTDQLGGDLKLIRGDYFNQREMETDVREIKDKYGRIGYVKADIRAEPRLLEEPGMLDLVYNIDEGHRYIAGRVEPVIAEEYPHTKLSTVLNRLSIRPGDIINIDELRASEIRLEASELFENNRYAGIYPRIVLTEPETDSQQTPEREGRPQIAQPPRLTRFRGQSPDPRPQAPRWAPTRPAPPTWSGSRNGGY
ncbi:MAG: hypothetical protein JW818_09445 [Pirellulales bacterium]|nr:hypothetical protein [Pirellulales bacterium]